MNKRILWPLSIALVFGATARAGTPLPPQLLAEVDAILSSCGEIDEPEAGKFRALHRTLVAGKTDRQLDAEEKSLIYRDTLKAVKAVLQAMPRDDAMQLCRATIQEVGQPEDSRVERR